MTSRILVSRLRFLSASSVLAVGTMLAPTHADAVPRRHARVRPTMTGNELLPTALPPAILEAFAATAVDAARRAGAVYADVRVGESHHLWVTSEMDEVTPIASFGVDFGYGIRVFIDGAWAFSHGTVPDFDTVAATAVNAVATARGYARFSPKHEVLLPNDSTTGTWTAPVQIDPFTVPLVDQVGLQHAWLQAATRYPGGGRQATFVWQRQTRAFASTEGARLTQSYHRANPRLYVAGQRYQGQASMVSPRINAVTAGYEAVLVPDLQEQIKVDAELMVRLSQLPEREMDVGRYPMITDGHVTGALLGKTVGPALELDRVLGEEADTSEGSFLGPDALGTEVFPAALSVTADRARTNLDALKWDDEGVETHPFPVITNGKIVGFHTSRTTAPALRQWYERRGHPVRSNGCAIAPRPWLPVLVRAPHLTMAPSANTASLDELVRSVPHGIMFQQMASVSTDPQCTSGFADALLMLEIKRGQVVGRVRRTGIEFRTQHLWKNLQRVGDATTTRTSPFDMAKGQPWSNYDQSTTAPAVLFKDVNVVSTGRSF
jgi:TldD protein